MIKKKGYLLCTADNGAIIYRWWLQVWLFKKRIAKKTKYPSCVSIRKIWICIETAVIDPVNGEFGGAPRLTWLPR